MEYGVSFRNIGRHNNGEWERRVVVTSGFNGDGPVIYERSFSQNRVRQPKFQQIASLWLESQHYTPRVRAFFYQYSLPDGIIKRTVRRPRGGNVQDPTKIELGNLVSQLYADYDTIVMNTQRESKFHSPSGSSVLQAYTLSSMDSLVDGTGKSKEESLAELRNYWRLE